MRRALFICAAAAVTLAVAVSPSTGGAGRGSLRSSMLVSTVELATRLSDRSLVLLHVGDRAEYDAAHIPGARYVALADISTPRGEGLTLELPPVEKLEATFEGLGVSDDSRVVVYMGKDWVSPTARVYFTLDALGFGDRTAILDGGLPAWRAEGRPVTAEVPAAKPGSFTPRLRKELVVDAAFVSANAKRPNVALVDARDTKFYDGVEKGMATRAGHIPGAASVPFSSLFEESGKLKSADALRAALSGAGAEAGDTVVSYCHIGQQASVVYFAARYLGYDAKLYDGSFQDWSARPELPVEK